MLEFNLGARLGAAVPEGPKAVCAGRASPIESLLALPPGSIRHAVFREMFLDPSPALGAARLQRFLRAVARDDGNLRSVAVDLAQWLINARVPATLVHDPQRPARVRALDALRDAARAAGYDLAAAVLTDAPPQRKLSPRGRLAEVCIDAEAPFKFFEHLPAGLSHNVRLVEQLRRHQDERAIARLLDSPWVRARDAVFIAARRPTTAPIARAVASRAQWLVHLAVRDALAENPFTPAEIAAPLVPTLSSRALLRLRDSGAAHPVLELAARCFLSLRDEGLRAMLHASAS